MLETLKQTAYLGVNAYALFANFCPWVSSQLLGFVFVDVSPSYKGDTSTPQSVSLQLLFLSSSAPAFMKEDTT